MAKPQRLRAMRETWLAVFSDAGYRDENDEWVAASPFSATEHHVALTLATYMSPNGDSCYPSIPRLAIGSGRADSTVRDALGKLVEFGFLERASRRGRGNSNEYVARIPDYFGWETPAEENRRRAAVFASGHEQLVTGPVVVRVPDALPEPLAKTAGERRFSEVGAAGENRRSDALKPPVGPKETAGHRRGSNQDQTRDHSRTEEAPDGASSVSPDESVDERELRRQDIELALSVALGVQLKSFTRSEWGAWGSVVLQLLDAGATGEHVAARCAAYRLKWPAVALTPVALARHWALLGAKLELDAPGASLARWIGQTSWRLDEEQARTILEDRGLPAHEIAQLLERRFSILTEQVAADAATRELLEGRVA